MPLPRPAAPRRPAALRAHGDERVDDWYWLRERDDPEVLAYLEAENAYADAVMAPTAELQERLYEEFRSRIRETDDTVPARRGEHWYYRRTVEGLQYPIHCRRRGRDGPEQVVLDGNALAEGSDYFALGAFEVAPGGRLLAYATDLTGGERHTLRIRDLETGRDLPDVVENVYYGVAWADDETLLYTRPNAAMRPWQVWRHRVGSPAEDDALVLEDGDERFFVSVERTRSGAFVVVTSESKLTTEVRVLPAGETAAALRELAPRRHGVEVHVEHADDGFVLLTNEGAPNFELVHEDGRVLVPHRDDVRLLGADAFAGHLVVSERAEALRRIVVDGDPVEQPEDVYTARVGENYEFDSPGVRLEYTSLVTPPSVVEVDFETGARRVLKEDDVPGYDASQYVTQRLWATAADGERIPISLVARRDRPRDRPGPLLLHGYGSYEISYDPRFSPLRISLLDRGFAVAFAHVRGGGELGRRWYEQGKFEHKPNTFGDFVACAEHVVAEGWTEPSQLAARGASAGGLLMGAVLNLRPDLFGCVVAQVPFVDALTTMLDESLPLTATEWEEWGDPVGDRRFYDLLKSYSPYDNVEAKRYPPLLVTAGLNDPRVAYWEPAKWVAKLRATKLGDDVLLLKTQLGAGHGGPSGRYDAWREEAFVFAFILRALGVDARNS